MNGFMKILFRLSISGALLTILLFLCRPCYKNVFSKKWQYYLWLIVILRLLLPFKTSYTPPKRPFPQTAQQTIGSLTEPEEQSLSYNETDIPKPVEKNKDAKTAVSFIQSFPEERLKEIFQSMEQPLFFLWLIVAVTLFIRKITTYQNFVQYIKTSQTELSDLNLWERLGRLLEQEKIRKTVSLSVSSLISSPMLIGWIHPCIVLPKEELSEMDFQNTIRHETVHLKRNDMLYKWLLQLTVCLHWFNPFVYLMQREVNRLCELSCDEEVIKNYNEKERRDYKDTLLYAAGIRNFPLDAPNSIYFWKNKKLLQERLETIMKFKKKSGLCTLLSVVLSSSFIVTAAASGDILLDKGAVHDIAAEKESGTSGTDTTQHSISKVKSSDYNTNADSYRKRLDKMIQNNRVYLENGQYYILCQGAKKDVSGGVTPGSIGIVVVKRNGYASFGPFDDMDHLVDDVTDTLNHNPKNGFGDILNAKQKGLVMALAEKIQSGSGQIEDLNDISADNYVKCGITTDKDGYYYKGKRIRALLVVKANGSMKSFGYDKKGSTDLLLTRNKKGRITAVERMSRKEADSYIHAANVLP